MNALTLSLRRMAVHRKLMTMLMVTSGSALLVAAIASLAYQYVQFRHDLAMNVGASATLILGNVRSAVSFRDPEDARTTLGTLSSTPGIRLACLYLAEGQLFADYKPDPAEPACPASPPPVGHVFSSGRLALAQRDTVEGKPTEWILLSSDLHLVTTRLRTQAALTALVLIGAMIIAYLLSNAFQRLVSAPIVELADIARSVSVTGDYSKRAVKRSEDELGVMAESFNNMLDRITVSEAAREVALAREQEANRTKDEFLATLSHELRTPLSAILGWTQLLRRQLVPVSELDKGLERIERNAQTQNRLISDLLDVSRILSGKLSLQRQAVDLVPVTRSIVESLMPLAQAKQVSLRTEFSAEQLLANIDADRISQVINNLLSNALKFTPANGEVRASVRRVGEMQELTVSDTGAGIAADFLPRVFEPFRQADASHTRAHGGLGLGLAIAKRITEMHGGEVTAHSDGVGRGATFTVRLPAAAVPAKTDASAANAKPASPDLAHCRILVVDDDQDSRDVTVAALTAAGATATGAASAEEALAMIFKAAPDVLVTDIAMPQTDGYTFVQRLREMLGRDGPQVLIALTAFASVADSDRSMREGFDAHVTKPFDPALLVATIHEQLSARKLHK